MSKQVIHKTCRTWGVTQCWLFVWPECPKANTVKTTYKWDRTTCKNCLKGRPKKKVIPIVDETQPFSYALNEVPYTYRCGKCGKHGVKLWREYNTFLNHQKLFCCECAGKHEDTLNVKQILPNGKIPWFYRGQPMGWTDQIGSLIPAVPTEQNDTYWGYTSVPQPGCEWWVHLPNTKR